jgi:hypothetical protein
MVCRNGVCGDGIKCQWLRPVPVSLWHQASGIRIRPGRLNVNKNETPSYPVAGRYLTLVVANRYIRSSSMLKNLSVMDAGGRY